MQYLTKIVLSVVMVFSVGFGTAALAQQSAQESAAGLRVQLADVQARQVELQTRLQELEEALKPESIASGLAGVGSTHPEELREQRRRQLANEKTGVSAQLDRLVASRSRLETALQEAETKAYHQSAEPTSPSVNPKGPSATSVDSPTTPPRPITHRRSRQVKRHKAKRPRASTAPSIR